MIFHIIEIILLLMILTQLGVEVSGPTDIWSRFLLVLGALLVIVFERYFYSSEPDYNKIRDIIREELEKEEK